MEPNNEININPNNTPDSSNNSSAVTILISIIVIAIIALAFYFGFYHRGGTNAPSDVNVDLNVPDLGGNSGATPAPTQ